MDKPTINPLISVIVPVYNVEQHLNKCIDSIIHQTYANLEIILVDDGSPDNCGVICDEYAKIDSRIKVIHKDNEGVSKARNTGIAIATGEWISFIDSDDWIDRDLYSSIMKNPISDDLVIFDVRYIYPNLQSNEAPKLNEKTIKIDDTNINQIFELFFSSKLGYTCNKLYRKDKICMLSFPAFSLREDLLFALAYLNNINSIRYIPICGYNYLQRPESLLHKSNIDNFNCIDSFENHVRKGISKISKKHNLALYNYIILICLTDILIKDILRNKDLSQEEKSEYTKKIFNKKFIKNLKFRYCKNKLHLLFVFCLKLHNYNLFMKIMK